MTLALGSLGCIETIRKKRNGIRIESEFGIHDFGMETLDALRQKKRNGIQYEQNPSLESMTLAWSSLGCIEQLKEKRNGIRTKPDFGIHDFGMEFPWMH